MLSKVSRNLSAHGLHSEIWMQNAEPGWPHKEEARTPPITWPF